MLNNDKLAETRTMNEISSIEAPSLSMCWLEFHVNNENSNGFEKLGYLLPPSIIEGQQKP